MAEPQFVMVPWDLPGAQNLSASEFRLLVLLLQHMDANGDAWPSQATLGKKMQFTRQAVKLILDSLVSKEFITRKANGAGGDSHWRYHLKEELQLCSKSRKARSSRKKS